ncbi:MAG: T9SS type A sorting domain-containing protein [Candidatus Firestonebacteria bacterium]|nr:T9SS type A sorting domain-containing protein [Candidatus Firestonebacteria bacterium]
MVPVPTGTSTSTPTVTKTASSGIIATGEPVLVYPNPAKDTVSFQIAAGESGEIRVRIFKISGREAAELSAASNGSAQTLVWVRGDAAAGIYVYIVYRNSKLFRSGKFGLQNR